MHIEDDTEWTLLIPSYEEIDAVLDDVMAEFKPNLLPYAVDDVCKHILQIADGSMLDIEITLNVTTDKAPNGCDDVKHVDGNKLKMEISESETGANNGMMQRGTTEFVLVPPLFTAQLVNGLDDELRTRLAHVLVSELFEEDELHDEENNISEDESTHQAVPLKGLNGIASFYQQIKDGKLPE